MHTQYIRGECRMRASIYKRSTRTSAFQTCFIPMEFCHQETSHFFRRSLRMNDRDRWGERGAWVRQTEGGSKWSEGGRGMSARHQQKLNLPVCILVQFVCLSLSFSLEFSENQHFPYYFRKACVSTNLHEYHYAMHMWKAARVLSILWAFTWTCLAVLYMIQIHVCVHISIVLIRISHFNAKA